MRRQASVLMEQRNWGGARDHLTKAIETANGILNTHIHTQTHTHTYTSAHARTHTYTGGNAGKWGLLLVS
jgi:ABC-type nickel/cobalt efflux system permease component RcnA